LVWIEQIGIPGDAVGGVANASQDTTEILVSLTLVTDIFTISGESSGIVAAPPHHRNAGMTAIRVTTDDRMAVAGRLRRRDRSAGRAGA
jgi:hypothetical protein